MAVRVAVVGLAFRFPSTTTERYWNDLLAGRDLVTEVDESRWPKDTFLHPGKDHPGTAYTFAAGSIGEVSGFDAAFFGISPREAALMDPQQRLLLELCWETLEHAGIKPSSLRGSDCGVYLGISSTDYAYRFADDLNAIDASLATGNTCSVAANRLSYLFDFHGPSMAIDTACSSSLVAFHHACRAVASGEVSQAFAGGISLHLHPFGFVTFSKASMLSPKGRCNVFDAAGDGYVRAEGGGLFLLKDYDRAVADGDRILAVVAGSAVNTDGRKTGLTVPNPQAQAALMRQAYAQAGIAPEDVDYLEAHGTGTAVGDPIEAQAIGAALGSARPSGRPLPIGSVKSNMGHLEAASGVAGLVKAIHCLRHRTVPATIGIKTLNPNIDFGGLNLQVVTENLPLPAGRVLTVGVNSFGFGGANAHVILQSPAEPAEPPAAPPGGDRMLPWVVSGKSQAALQAAARDLAGALEALPAGRGYDAAYHAYARRDWHERRAIVHGSDPSAVARLLRAFADGSAPKHAIASGTELAEAKGPVFAYSGNGSQWAGMGRQLLADPVFAQAVAEIDAAFEPLAGWRLAEQLARDDAPEAYERTEIAQPALFSLQVGITRMLAAHGIRPTAVLGHSVGEVAAAWACGALSLADAVTVIFHRSRLQGTTKGRGAMTAVGIDGEAAQALLAELRVQDEACVAGFNSSRGATLAGSPEALARVEAALAERRLFQRRLDLDYAFHSAAMEPIRGELLQALRGLAPGQARLPFHSTVLGGECRDAALDADYWWRNVRLPVRFEPAARALAEQGDNLFVEIGPHPVLRGYLSDALKGAGRTGRVLVTASRGEESVARITETAGQVILAGAPVDTSVYFPVPGRHVDLPAYPWQRERYWHPVTAESLGQLSRRRVHPLLGYPLPQAEATWENHLDTSALPMLADHVVGEAVVYPGAGFVEMALAASQQWLPGPCAEIEELEIHAPLLLAAQPSKLTRFALDRSDGRFRIQAKDLGSHEAWTAHASGRVLREPGAALLDARAPQAPARAPDFDAASHYALTRAVGLAYGPCFQAVSHGWRLDGQTVLAHLAPPPAVQDELSHALLHPALLDCAFQLVVPLLKDDPAFNRGIAFVPAKLGRLCVRTGLGAPDRAVVRLLARGPHSLTADIALFDGEGRQIAAVRQARFRAVRLSKAQDDKLDFIDTVGTPRPHPRAPLRPAAVSSEAVRGALAKVVDDAVSAGAHVTRLGEVEPLLESLCDQYAREALREVGAGSAVLSDALVERLAQATPAIRPLLAHLLERGVAGGWLQRGPDGWAWTGEAGGPEQSAGAADAGEAVTSADIWNTLVREYPDAFAVVHAVGRIGLNLVAILRGEADPSALIPRDTTPASLARDALGEATLQTWGSAMAQVLQDAQAALPAGSRLSVLEVGPDAAPLAMACCAVLDFGVSDYRYAAITQAARDRAAERLEAYPDAQAVLIDDSAESVAELADLVIVHADHADLQDGLRALRYASRRLKPSGSLVLRGAYPCGWADFLFGSQPQWWMDTVDGERTSMQRVAEYWRLALSQQGLACEPPLAFAPDALSGPYLLHATRERAAIGPAQSPAAQGSWAILAGPHDSALADAVGAQLAADGQRVHVLRAAEPAALAGLLDEACAQDGGLQGIVHLDGISAGAAVQDKSARLHAGAGAGAGTSASSGAGVDAGPGASVHANANAQARLAAQVHRCALAGAVAQWCESRTHKPAVWLVTAGAMQHCCGPAAQGSAGGAAGAAHTAADGTANDHALWGFGRTLMNEASGYAVRLVDVPAGAAPQPLAVELARELLHPDAEQEVALAGSDGRYAPRMRRVARPQGAAQDTPPAGSVRLGFDFPGQLRNLRWQAEAPRPLGDDELDVQVHATGLNFRDVMYALGLLSDEAIENGYAGPTLGLEFSGTVLRAGAAVEGLRPGDAVVGFGPASFADRVQVKTDAVARLPARCSFEAAATIPSTFFTVYYALHHLARLEAGEKVLIHGAAGGVGIAAIQYAQWCGAEIHATAGSDEKRDFLRLMGVQHIYDSRSLSFADEVLASTGGQGVDVVLNSLAGEAINRNLRVLRPFGRFLELGKRDFYENTRIGLRPFRNNISYFGIDADQLMRERPALTRRLFAEMMDLFEQGALHPLPYHEFDAADVVAAFRYMQQARQIGKIVVTYRRGLPAAARPPAGRRPALALPADATYLVTGGLGGFGLRTAQWLADKGARHLVLASRSGPAADDAQAAIQALQARGVTVHAAACDVTDRAALGRLLEEAARQLPPLRGIVHAAMVIDDGLAHSTSAEQLQRVLAPKVLGAMHLDALTRDLPLDFFVCFSSATTVFGNPGQAAYVAANSWLEGLARRRRAQGLPATCVCWGAIDDVGYLARNTRIKEALQGRMGGAALPAALALDALEDMLLADASGLGVLELDWRALSRFLPTAGTPKFAEIAARAGDAGGDDGAGLDIAELLATLDDAALLPVLQDMLKAEIGEILRLPPEKLDVDQSVYDIGLDSLMGVELVVALENRFGVRLPVMALNDSPTIAKLARRLLALLRGEDHDAAPLAGEVEQLIAKHSDDEAHLAAATDLANAVQAQPAANSHRMIH